jgi:hypothetical protein
MRTVSLLFVAILALGFGAGCSSTSPSADGGGSGGSGSVGTGGSAATGGSGGKGGAGGTGGALGTGGASGAGGTMTCSPACGSGSICVATGAEGGALLFPNDAGVCPTGRHLSGPLCVSDLSYSCMTIPAGCAGAVTCACASSLCSAPYACFGLSGGILSCIQAVP